MADDGHWRCEKTFGIVEAGDIASAVLGEVGRDLAVKSDDGDAEHERKGETNPLAETGMFEVKDRTVSHTGAVGSVGIQEKRSEIGSGEGADTESGDAHTVGEEDSS